MKICHLLLLGMFTAFFSVVHAQTACPPGMEEYGAGVCGYSQTEEPAQQQAQQPQQSAPPPPQWIENWGAIATHEPDGSLGTSNDMPSQSTAEQSALANCQSKHGSVCKIQIAYNNECAAMVVGDKIYNTSAGATKAKAIQKSMGMCSAATTHCQVYYSACSLPVRIQ